MVSPEFARNLPVEIADTKQAGDLLAQALKVAEGIIDANDKANALRQIAVCNAKIRNWKLARRVTRSIGNDKDKTEALSAILQIAWAKPKTVSDIKNFDPTFAIRGVYKPLSQ